MPFTDLLSELSVIYGVSSIQVLQSEEEVLHASENIATMMLGVRYFGLISNEGSVVASSGFKGPALLLRKIVEGKSNQFVFPFQSGDRKLTLFMERSSPITDRERRVYTIFARNLQTALSNAYTIKKKEKIEKELKTSLKEKDMLLREVHHRVKNNMQIISSLLSLQSNYVDGEAVNVLKESQDRVKSMAMIHEKLYQSSSLTHIDFAEYLQSLLNNLLRSYNGNSGNVTLNMNVERVFLNIETAMPLGLTVNEIVSNSLKHAFPGGEGTINLKLHRVLDGLELQISDNGVGMPENFKETNSLGLQLVSALVNQLDGTVELKVDNGTCYNIKFRELRYKKRI